VPFQAHFDLLQFFQSHRGEIVERIQELLNAQRKPSDYLQDGPVLFQLFEACFFTLPGITPSQSALRNELEEAHWADGFEPRELPDCRTA
jgi:hypothetical protein